MKKLTVLLSLVALEGFAALAGQSVVVRELLTTFGGNELVIGLVFGFWLLWVATGAAATSKILKPVDEGAAGSACESGESLLEDRSTLVVAAALGPALVVEFVLVRVVAGGLFTRPGELPGLLWTAAGAMLLLAPFSLLVGAFFPLAARSVARVLGPGRNAAALVYATEAGGSLAGGLAFTFIFAGRVSHTAFVLILGAVFLALAAAAAWKRIRRRGAFVSISGGFAIALVALGAFASRAIERATARRGGRIDPSYRVIASRDTRYQHLLLVEREGQHVLFAGGEPALSCEPADPGPWLAAHRALARAESVERCLIMGFDPAAVRAALDQGAKHVDVVEQDPGVIELVEPLLTDEDRARLEDDRVHLHNAEARRFLARKFVPYDAVLLGARDPTSALVNRFFTREFFERVEFADGGMLTFSASSQANTLDDDALRYLRGLRRTLDMASVTGVEKASVGGGWGSILLSLRFSVLVADDEGAARFFAFAGDGLPFSVMSRDGDEVPIGTRERPRQRVSPEALRQRMRERYPPLAPYFTDANLAPERGRKLDELTRPVPETPVDTDLHPRAYLNFLRIWDRLSGSGVRSWLDLAGALRVWHMIALALVVAAVGAPLAGKAGGVTRPAAFVGGAAGFAGMVVTIVLLLAYQSLHGLVYQAVGALSAAFMAGFAGGSFAAERLARRRTSPKGAALAADAAGVVVILLSLGLLGTGAMRLPVAGSALFVFLLALAGVTVGFELPLLAHWIALEDGKGADPRTVARAAGTIDAADHAGAFAGALLAGTLLVPALGILGALVALAALRLASLAALGVRAVGSV